MDDESDIRLRELAYRAWEAVLRRDDEFIEGIPLVAGETQAGLLRLSLPSEGAAYPAERW